VASAGPYASLHLTPDRQPPQHPTTQFLQAGCPSCRPINSVKALKLIVNFNWKYLTAEIDLGLKHINFFPLLFRSQKLVNSCHMVQHDNSHSCSSVSETRWDTKIFTFSGDWADCVSLTVHPFTVIDSEVTLVEILTSVNFFIVEIFYRLIVNLHSPTHNVVAVYIVVIWQRDYTWVL